MGSLTPTGPAGPGKQANALDSQLPAGPAAVRPPPGLGAADTPPGGTGPIPSAPAAGNGRPSHLFLQNGAGRLPVRFGATRATSVRPARPQAQLADPPTASVSREQTETGGAIVARRSIARGRG